MRISRIRVEEGFLDGLDLEFSDGLNVIIGPRGAGKTSIIELLRFCLGVPSYSSSFAGRSREHALSVLGSGRVTVTLDVNGTSLTATRSAGEEEAGLPSDLSLPIVLSQNEIESVGLSAGGRLRLLDGFRRDQVSAAGREARLLAEIRSATAELRSLSHEIQEIDDQVATLVGLEEQLSQAEEMQRALLRNVEASGDKQDRLRTLSESTAALSATDSILARTASQLERWLSLIQDVDRKTPEIESWPESEQTPDALASVRAAVHDAAEFVTAATRRIGGALEELVAAKVTNADARSVAENEARGLRREIDVLQEGAGEASRAISSLKERLAQRSVLVALRTDRVRALETLRERRGRLLSELDALREQRFEDRRSVATGLNDQLRPSIDILLERSAVLDEYKSAIAEALRGSGLRYNALAENLAAAVSPRELSELIEIDDSERLAEVAGIGKSRAERVISYITSSGVESLLTCRVEDGVSLRLFTGGDHRASDALSTGQRCTVVLPILLCASDRVLIVDQPEDHLDNAFVVSTLIQSIGRRRGGAQMIFSTHNPNIPVLGEAKTVVCLDSDGRRGFVRHAHPLDHPNSVEAITTLMEGGREAFERRAVFYSSAGRKHDQR